MTDRTRYKRVLVLTAVLVAVSMLFTSCGIIIINDNSGADVTTVPEDTTSSPDDTTSSEKIDKSPTLDYLKLAGDYVTAVPAYDFDGADIVISGIGAEKFGGVNANEAGTINSLNKSKRNKLVQDALNGKLVFTEPDVEGFYESLKEAVNSGERFSDLLIVPQQVVGELALAGLLYDVSELDCNYQEPYFDFNAMQSSGGNVLYAVIGDATKDPDYLYGVYFNKTLVTGAGLELPYKLVESGEWTFDRFLEYMDTVSASEHGIEDLAIHAFVDVNYADILFEGAGFSMITSVFGEAPVITEPTEEAESFMEKLKNLFETNPKWAGDSPETKFADGEMLYYVSPLQRSNALSTAAADWGIVPMPKGSKEQQNYRTLADPDMPVVVVPKNITDKAETSSLVSALFAASYKYLGTAYAENQMSYFLRDSESVNMVYRIINSAVYDGAYMFSSAYATVSNATITSLRNAALGKSTIRNYYDFYASKADNSMKALKDSSKEQAS